MPAAVRMFNGVVEDASSNNNNAAKASQPHRSPTHPKLNSLVSTLITNCLACNGNYHLSSRGKNGAFAHQFVELQGIRFIGLGAVCDELSPRERVFDTLEVFRTKTERLVSIGFILDKDPSGKTVETIPLEFWTREVAEERTLSAECRKIIELVSNKQFGTLVNELSTQLRKQKGRIYTGVNFFQAGITAHNLGVAKVLAGLDKEADIDFREAIELKEAAYGEDHEEVALSWDQLGIQLFARGQFMDASKAFEKAHQVRKHSSDSHPILAMTLNNIACCEFQRGKHLAALEHLEEARTIQHNAASSPNDLDLLHVAIVYGNCGYLKLALKEYDEARAIFEEALLIQQSVLDDNHRAVRDTLSNIEFTNAFHS